MTVEPADHARLAAVARTRNGKIAAIALALTGPVEVRAWRGSSYIGELALPAS